jgi:hypothetical protein
MLKKILAIFFLILLFVTDFKKIKNKLTQLFGKNK